MIAQPVDNSVSDSAPTYGQDASKVAAPPSGETIQQQQKEYYDQELSEPKAPMTAGADTGRGQGGDGSGQERGTATGPEFSIADNRSK